MRSIAKGRCWIPFFVLYQIYGALGHLPLSSPHLLETNSYFVCMSGYSAASRHNMAIVKRFAHINEQLSLHQFHASSRRMEGQEGPLVATQHWTKVSCSFWNTRGEEVKCSTESIPSILARKKCSVPRRWNECVFFDSSKISNVANVGCRRGVMIRRTRENASHWYSHFSWVLFRGAFSLSAHHAPFPIPKWTRIKRGINKRDFGTLGPWSED